MKKILVTGGTVFVSRYAAEYFVERGYEVYVLNRGTRPQPEGAHLFRGDRHDLVNLLKNTHFDAVVDVTAYTKEDIADLLNGLDRFEQYIMVSSSAVYPETGKQPFAENEKLAPNQFWGKYGTDKIEAEHELLTRVPNAYIVRPPYLYGPMNNVYREAFVFDCALAERPFYLPGGGDMKLQFFHVQDLCRFLEILIEQKPGERIFNVGNRDAVSVEDWVKLCYAAAGKKPEFVRVHQDVEQRNYFPFYNYEYCLDVTKQCDLLDDPVPLDQGLREALRWYLENMDKVNKKPLIPYIEEHLALA